MANVLIAGCGDIGCLLGIQLSEQGHQVFGLRRNVELLPDCIQPVEANLTMPIDNLPPNIDYVFYMASAGKYKDCAYYQAYVLGLKNLISALQNHPIKKLFFISSSSVFGQCNGEQVSEACPTDDSIFSTKRLLEGEEIAFNSNLNATVVRFGGIYGPGRTHLIDLIKEGKAHCMEGVWSNRIHSEDCAGMLAYLLEQNEVNPERVESLYAGVDNQPTLSCEVHDWLSEQLSAPEPDRKEPSEASRLMRSNKRISNAKIRTLGYEFKYPTYKEGFLGFLGFPTD
ncbi:Nucleoside-diphosphate-sugar epimerases [hydrothermal vent metagenome]|uniref:Nucleoside-diphosphate-sugar epimerases n=1 Tax=hydrothermal vent metagenome TaxID=652676 RepID=A0A3B0WRM0_9ZZZZ